MCKRIRYFYSIWTLHLWSGPWIPGKQTFFMEQITFSSCTWIASNDSQLIEWLHDTHEPDSCFHRLLKTSEGSRIISAMMHRNIKQQCVVQLLLYLNQQLNPQDFLCCCSNWIDSKFVLNWYMLVELLSQSHILIDYICKLCVWWHTLLSFSGRLGMENFSPQDLFICLLSHSILYMNNLTHNTTGPAPEILTSGWAQWFVSTVHTHWAEKAFHFQVGT